MINILNDSVSNIPLWQALCLGGAWGLGTSFLVTKSLVKVQQLISDEVKGYLTKTLTNHKEETTEQIKNEVGLQIDNQTSEVLEEVREELQQALKDKTIAEDAQVIA